MYKRKKVGHPTQTRRNGGVFMRKIKVLVTLFVVMLVLSTDLGTFFSDSSVKQQSVQTAKDNEEKNENVFQFAYLKHNLGCITSALQSVISSKTKAASDNFANRYTNAVADVTTKSVEKAITGKTAKVDTAKVKTVNTQKTE